MEPWTTGSQIPPGDRVVAMVERKRSPSSPRYTRPGLNGDAMTRSLVALCAFALACGDPAPPTLEGQVLDVWGAQVAGASILIDGNNITADDHGYFSIANPAYPLTLRVGKDGYVQDEIVVTAAEDGSVEQPTVALYPRPEERGFYVVGQTSYQKLEPTSVQVIGNELSKVSGLQAISETAGRSPFEVIFQTELRLEEVTRLGLELHKLTYSAKVEIAGPFGTEEADANLYTSAGTVPVELSPMRSRDAYRVVPSEVLEPGWYAFQVQDVLDPNNALNLASLPDAQKVAWAFEYKP